MRNIGIFCAALLLSVAVSAQTVKQTGMPGIMAEKGILNHLDVGVNVGTVGIGIDLAVPVTNFARVRVGYEYMPGFTLHSNFSTETSGGGKPSDFIAKIGRIPEKLANFPDVDINQPLFDEERWLLQQYVQGNLQAKDYVSMGMKPNLHQFKFLVDVMPFRNNNHWSLTLGFFVGSPRVGKAFNLDGETPLLRAVNLYNEKYYKQYVLNEMQLRYGDGETQLTEIPDVTNIVKKNGLAGFPLGRFPDGRKALMLPGSDATARAEMQVSPVRPYLGLGYNTQLSRNGRLRLNVDAGVLFLCGKPHVYVDNVYRVDDGPLVLDENYNWVSGFGVDPDYGRFYGEVVRNYVDPETWDEEYREVTPVEKLDHVDLMRDLHDIPGKVGRMVNTISKLKVYPNVSVTVSYRLF